MTFFRKETKIEFEKLYQEYLPINSERKNALKNDDKKLISEIYSKYRELTTKLSKLFENEIEYFLEKEYKLKIGMFHTKEEQFSKGENKLGIEIKFDMESLNTGNLYFEISEKSKPREGEYCTSGVFRKDNSISYLIGNHERFFIILKKEIIKYIDNKKDKLLKDIKTSKGFPINIEVVKKLPEVLSFEFQTKPFNIPKKIPEKFYIKKEIKTKEIGE